MHFGEHGESVHSRNAYWIFLVNFRYGGCRVVIIDCRCHMLSLNYMFDRFEFEIGLCWLKIMILLEHKLSCGVLYISKQH